MDISSAQGVASHDGSHEAGGLDQLRVTELGHVRFGDADEGSVAMALILLCIMFPGAHDNVHGERSKHYPQCCRGWWSWVQAESLGWAGSECGCLRRRYLQACPATLDCSLVSPFEVSALQSAYSSALFYSPWHLSFLRPSPLCRCTISSSGECTRSCGTTILSLFSLFSLGIRSDGRLMIP